jgi:purine nucleoside phosphorylase
MYFHSSAAKMVAPAVIGGSGLGSLSEPLILKNEETTEEQEQEEEAPIPSSSIGVIIGAMLLGVAG